MKKWKRRESKTPLKVIIVVLVCVALFSVVYLAQQYAMGALYKFTKTVSVLVKESVSN